jgi:hypothetical protein
MVPITISIQATFRVFDQSMMAKKAASAPVTKRLTIKRTSPVSMIILSDFYREFARGSLSHSSHLMVRLTKNKGVVCE